MGKNRGKAHFLNFDAFRCSGKAYSFRESPGPIVTFTIILTYQARLPQSIHLFPHLSYQDASIFQTVTNRHHAYRIRSRAARCGRSCSGGPKCVPCLSIDNKVKACAF